MPWAGGQGATTRLIWTASAAHAYSSGTGQWTTQPLASYPLGGYASSGLGLVWTNQAVHIYDPVGRSWNTQSISDPEGVSVDGVGKVGIVWSSTAADAYSATLGTWSPVSGSYLFEGGAAGAEVALLWTSDRAFAFDPNDGVWVQVATEVPAGVAPASFEPEGFFSLGPNPATGPLSIHLPAAREPWRIEIVNLQGARVRSVAPAGDGAVPEIVAWDRTDDQSRPLPSGTYWVRAQAGDRVEARRFVTVR